MYKVSKLFGKWKQLTPQTLACVTIFSKYSSTNHFCLYEWFHYSPCSVLKGRQIRKNRKRKKENKEKITERGKEGRESHEQVAARMITERGLSKRSPTNGCRMCWLKAFGQRRKIALFCWISLYSEKQDFLISMLTLFPHPGTLWGLPWTSFCVFCYTSSWEPMVPIHLQKEDIQKMLNRRD